MAEGKRYNGKCKVCKKKHTALLVRVENVLTEKGWHYAWKSAEGAVVLSGPNGLPVVTCECGKRLYIKVVVGTVVAEKGCDGRCMSATGHVCECACGGKNHGANGHAH